MKLSACRCRRPAPPVKFSQWETTAPWNFTGPWQAPDDVEKGLVCPGCLTREEHEQIEVLEQFMADCEEP